MDDPPLSSSERFHSFAKPALILFMVTVIGGACNYIYQVFMMNSLTVEHYSELAAVLSLFYIVSVPNQTVATMLLRYTSKFVAEGRKAQISWLMRRSMWISLAISGVMVLVLFLMTPWIVDYLSLTSDLPLYVMMVGIIVYMMTAVGFGTGQGLQRFNILSLNTLWPVGKLLFGILLVVAGFGVAGAMGGVVIGMSWGLMVVILGVRDYLSKKGEPIEKSDSTSILVYLIPVTAAVVCYAILTNVDIFLANHYLDKTQAGIYSTASTLGKIILVLPGAIGTVMFPKISEAHTKREDTVRIMRRSILYCLGLTGVAALVFLLAPNFVLTLLTSNKYADAAGPLQILGVSMMFFGLASLFMNYGLATNRRQYISVLIALTVVQFVLITLYHSTPMDIAYDMLATSMAICVFSWLYMELKFRTSATY
ncbi:MAG: Polysaccharide biosynthesis protein [Methanomassiliicoccales archaeon PtaU1.Bin124]|nr:MAG: Polysaccharide biosynthesis protein [Methanomassiliicoccales archaeon PtaU1.Bin124]